MWAAGGRDGGWAPAPGDPRSSRGPHGHTWHCVCHPCPRTHCLGPRVPYGTRCPLQVHMSPVGPQVPSGLTCPLWAHMAPMGPCPLWAHVSFAGSRVTTRAYVATVGLRVPYRLTSLMGSCHITRVPPWVAMSPHGLLRSLWHHVSPLGPRLPPTFPPGLRGLSCPLWPSVSPMDPGVTQGLLCPP